MVIISGLNPHGPGTSRDLIIQDETAFPKPKDKPKSQPSNYHPPQPTHPKSHKQRPQNIKQPSYGGRKT